QHLRRAFGSWTPQIGYRNPVAKTLARRLSLEPGRKPRRAPGLTFPIFAIPVAAAKASRPRGSVFQKHGGPNRAASKLSDENKKRTCAREQTMHIMRHS